MATKTRLEELRAKNTLTTSEMDELMRLSPPGTFKTLPNLSNIGVIDFNKAFKNYKSGADRSRIALQNGCYMEVISLRLQHSEFWLRLFYVAKNGKGKIYDLKDKKMFGAIINDCKQLGFRKDLIDRLRDFNEHRINAIHKYLLGGTDYDELKKVCSSSTGLDGEVGEYVRNEIGIPVQPDITNKSI